MVDERDHQTLLLPAPTAQGLWQDGVGGQGTGDKTEGQGDKTERRGAGCVEEMTGEQGSVHLHSAVLVPPRGHQDPSDTAALTQLESPHGADSPCSGSAGQTPRGRQPLPGLRSGSVAQGIAAQARCPQPSSPGAGLLPSPMAGGAWPHTTAELVSSPTRVCRGHSTMSPTSLPASCLCTGGTTCPSPLRADQQAHASKSRAGGGRMRLGQQRGPGPVVGRCPGADGGFPLLAKSLKGYHRGSATLNGLETGCPTGHEMPLEGAT